MNIEYLRLADGKTAVTNEKGKVKIIDSEVTGTKLVAENKLDIIDKQIDEIKRNIENSKETSGFSRTMLLILSTVGTGSILIGTLAGGGYGALISLIGVLGSCVPSIGVFAVANSVTKKKIIGNTAKLKKAEQLKKENTEILSRIETPTLTSQIIINEPISLEEQNKIELPLVTRELDDAYHNATKANCKRRVLIKK